MTIIAILFAFALCHFIRELSRVRNHRWLGAWIHSSSNIFSRLPGWGELSGFIIILFIPLLGMALVNQLVLDAFGQLGLFLLAVAVLVYTFGTRDIDAQVAEIIRTTDEDEQEQGP